VPALRVPLVHSLIGINHFRQKKQKEMKSPVFALFGVRSALFGAVRIIHAEVVEGEGDAQSCGG
jgi:hypothetical protein